MIVTGDFNCVPWLPEYGLPEGKPFTDTGYLEFRRSGFVDAFTATGQRDTNTSHTFHGYQGEAFNVLEDGMAQRIDWILWKDGAQSLKALSCQILRDAEPPIYPSDHYPLLAVFDYPDYG